ncbi:MAG: Rrf2 family transcriptional regulator [Hyphomicrobiales bacterium]
MAKIFTLSEAASIALHGMILVARSQEMMNVAHIAEATSSSKHHVAKVFQRLVKENLVSSLRGPSGGFFLKKEPNEITLLQIYEAIEGKIEVHACPLDKQVCPFDKCIMNNVTSRMTMEYRDYMKGQSLDMYL